MFMYICLMYSKELLKGTLQPIILRLLSENGQMYGYEITQRVKELTKGKITITEGALYPMLHKLEDEGVLKAELESIGNRVRKYYSLTKSGKTVSKQRVNELTEFIEALGAIFNKKQTV